MTVQGPVKKQQPDGMSHRGGGGQYRHAPTLGGGPVGVCGNVPVSRRCAHWTAVLRFGHALCPWPDDGRHVFCGLFCRSRPSVRCSVLCSPVPGPRFAPAPSSTVKAPRRIKTPFPHRPVCSHICAGVWEVGGSASTGVGGGGQCRNTAASAPGLGRRLERHNRHEQRGGGGGRSGGGGGIG